MARRKASNCVDFCRMKALVFSILLSLCCSGAFAQARMTTAEYIEKYAWIAVREMESFQIPASVKLGQGILESSSGNSPLAREANNHFGIKCKKEWTGPTYIQDDDEKDECFRKYPSVQASYEDHSQFLRKNQRYAELFTYSPSDYSSWAHGLKKAGYATNPKYAPLLIKTIEENRLYEYDKPGARPQYQPPLQGNRKPDAAITQGKNGRKPSTGGDLPDFELDRQRAKRQTETTNGVQYIIIKAGDSFESLSKELDMMPWQLPKYNDLPRTAALKPGERLYIQPKKRKGKESSHVVKPGETLHSIAQLHAIKLKRLYSLNSLEPGTQPLAGKTLKLR